MKAGPFLVLCMIVPLALLAKSVPFTTTFDRAEASEPSQGGLPSRGTTTCVSVASDGTQGDDDSWESSVSAHGRYVAFYSYATNLVDGDTNGVSDIFVHDRQTGQTTRVSVDSGGSQATGGNSGSPSLSADGRYVAFGSRATNLVQGDTNGVGDVFVHDRQTGQTTRVSVDSDGTQGNNHSSSPSISADGRYVAFYSSAGDLIVGDTNGVGDIFVHDRQTGQTTRVSLHSEGTQGNNHSSSPSVSADGRYVAFYSDATNLVDGDTNGVGDVFVHDRQTAQTVRVSIHSDGTQGDHDSLWDSPISADGRHVAFSSYAWNLVDGDTNLVGDVFIHDRQTRQTTRVSMGSDGSQGNGTSLHPSISADGRYVSFSSQASNLVDNDTNGTDDVFLHDRQTGETTRVSVHSDGSGGNAYSSYSSVSADGLYIAFFSHATNLVDGDTNDAYDIFVHGRLGCAQFLQLPFDPQSQDLKGKCASSSPNSLNCISSMFDHEYPLLPPGPPTYGTEPITPTIGQWIMIFNGLKFYTAGEINSPTDYGYSGHNGIDFRLPHGSPVVAVAPGRVTATGSTLKIDHGNGYTSAYLHLSRFADDWIHTGVEITQADVDSKRVIAYSGTAGSGAHLHFGVLFETEVLDPFKWTGGFTDPWVADYAGPQSRYCLWSFGCSLPAAATPTNAANLALPDGSTTVSVPAGAVTDLTWLSLTLTPDPVAAPSAVPTGYSFDLSAQDISGNPVETFVLPLTIVINYAESIVDYVIENTLILHYWDDASQSWLPLPTMVDLGNNTATATTDHLTMFSLLGEPQNPAPTITSVSPTGGYSHLDTEITIEGTGFLPTPSVQLGIGELGVTFVDSTTLTAVVPSGYDAGLYDLIVTNPDAQEATLESAFVVNEPLTIYLPLVLKNY